MVVHIFLWLLGKVTNHMGYIVKMDEKSRGKMVNKLISKLWHCC
jgi:hypothetical protein